MSSQEVLHAYRHLYRGLLHAVKFSIKGRYTVRDQLRKGFREENAKFDGDAIKRTLWFLDAAAKERGIEHKILKNLVRTARLRTRTNTVPWRIQIRDTLREKRESEVAADKVKEHVYNHYDMTIAMLNKRKVLRNRQTQRQALGASGLMATTGNRYLQISPQTPGVFEALSMKDVLYKDVRTRILIYAAMMGWRAFKSRLYDEDLCSSIDAITKGPK